MIEVQTEVRHAASYARVDGRLTGLYTLGILDRDRSLAWSFSREEGRQV